MKIGIDLGGSHIAIGVIDGNGRILEKTEKRLLSKEKKNIENSIESYIIEKTMGFQEKYKITSIGIAIPGTVTETEVVKSVNLGLKNYPIVERLKSGLHQEIPIQIRNDAKCAAIAENKYGALKNYERTIFLTLGTGIGGAVMLHGKLLDTGKFPGCEFGHMIIQKDGLPCKCGKNGCFEKYASMKAFKDNLRNALGVDEKTRGQELISILIKSEREGEIDQETNEKIQKVVQDFIENLSIGISNLVNIFEPEAIGIGGSFVYFQEILMPKLKQNLQEKKYLFNPRTSQELVVLPAILGNDAGMLGTGTD